MAKKSKAKKVNLPAAPEAPIYPDLTLGMLRDFGLPDTLAKPLFTAVTAMRGGKSLREANFVAWLVKVNLPHAHLKMIDAAGNVHFTVPTLSGEPSKTIFAAHTDTVQHTGGSNKAVFDGQYIRAVDQPLGADDGAGVALLCYMMASGVPGRYIFTRQEETGGIGAQFIADTMTNLLKKYDRAICFDRAGNDEIITVQGGTRCASSDFAEALSVALQDQNLLYVESKHGVYTDCKEWIGHVPECVNLSVGYKSQHGAKEHLDLQHFIELALAVIKLDWESLPTHRSLAKLDMSYVRLNFEDVKGSTKSKAKGYATIANQRVSALEDAIFDFYWGKQGDLRNMLVNRLAVVYGIDYEDANKHVSMTKLKEHQVDAIDYNMLDSDILDYLLQFTAVPV